MDKKTKKNEKMKKRKNSLHFWSFFRVVFSFLIPGHELDVSQME
jgi:hypothetical protein